MKNTLFVLTFLLFFSLAVFSHATIQFSDDFEYEESPEDHGWITNDKNFFTTNEVAKNGKRSLKGHVRSPEDGRLFLYYIFKESEFKELIQPKDTISLKVSFYDNYKSPNKFKIFLRRHFGDLYRKLYEKKGVANSRTAGFRFHLDFEEKYSKYTAVGISKTHYYFTTPQDIQSTSIKPRKNGWHDIEWTIKNNMISLHFDGKLVIKDLHRVDKLTAFMWVSVGVHGDLELYSWIDDVHFVRN